MDIAILPLVAIGAVIVAVVIVIAVFANRS